MHRSPSSVSVEGRAEQVDLTKLPAFTEADIKSYDGSTTDKPIYVAVGGFVFDVTEKGEAYYGLGGAYHAFAGRACTRGVVLPSLKPEDVNDDCEDFDSDQLAKKTEWIKFFRAKYPTVGKLIADRDAKRQREAEKQKDKELAAIKVAAKKEQAGRSYTLHELSKHDGTDAALPLLLAVSGHVLDVTSAAQFFGVGAAKQIYAGREISRALALVSPEYTTDAIDLTDDLTGLSEQQLDKMRGAVDYFLSRFPKLGEVVPYGGASPAEYGGADPAEF
jgi:membrane-associated progesterone receptor component